MSGIFINSDAWNFWETDVKDMTAEGIRKDVDFYTEKGGVEAIFYNMNFQRVFFPSSVWTPIWKDCEITGSGELLLRGKTTEQSYKQLVVNAKELLKNLPDFMAYRYRYCHERGVEMWHSMRMNDVHHTPLGLEHRPQHSDLWMDHKELLRAWYRHTWRSDWHDNAFDFGIPEVYEYHLALVKQYLLEFESDGIELDWLRSVPIFKPGCDELNRGIFTRFIRDVRAVADRAEKQWGHRLRIAVRVPVLVEDALDLGMDVPQWGREKLIDIVIPGPNNLSTEMETQVRLWRSVLPENVILAPCIDYNTTSHAGYNLTMTQETDAGFASAFYQGGADTIYLYNHFPSTSRRAYTDMQEFFSYAGDRRAVAAHARRQIVTRHDPCGEGKYLQICYPHEIWRNCCNGSVRINAGEQTAGRRAKIVIGATVPLNIDILLNTVPCPPLPGDAPLPKLPAGEAYYVQTEIPAGALHDGWNAVEIFNRNDTLRESELIWMEIAIERA